MKLTAQYLHAPSQLGSVPLPSVDVLGEFWRVADARQIAIATATESPYFSGWCVGLKIIDQNGKTVAEWSKGEPITNDQRAVR